MSTITLADEAKTGEVDEQENNTAENGEGVEPCGDEAGASASVGNNPVTEPEAAGEKVGSREISEGQRARHLREIEEAERHVGRCESEWESLKAETKDAKDDFDVAVEKLRECIRARTGSPGPLFEQAAPPGNPESFDQLRDAVRAAGSNAWDDVIDPVAAVQEMRGYDTWRSVPLATLIPKIGNRAIKALAGHNPPLATLGELADWQTKKGGFWMTDISGLGAKGREEIENAQMGYWASWNRSTASAVE